MASIRVNDRKLVQVVLVDDGSSPPLAPIISEYLNSSDAVLQQANRGRSAALRNGILAANSEFLLIMDSDDEFLPGALDRVVTDIQRLDPRLIGLVYECSRFDSGLAIAKLPAEVEGTLLSLRADHHIKGDLKEVVRTTMVKRALYPDPGAERRVPTSYIWAGVSSFGHVKTIDASVVRHRYLPGGMTTSIRKLKQQNPYWLARTYLRTATAPKNAYRSIYFRWLQGLKALAVPAASLNQEELLQLRRALGLPGFISASLGAKVLQLGKVT